MFKAKIVADSLCNTDRLTTWELTYPRFIHAEFMTHRVFSRNAASSRAIPLKRMVEAITVDPAMPMQWGANQPGMQANALLSPQKVRSSLEEWMEARDEALDHAETLAAIGCHKQIANRIIEPFAFITVLASATQVRNFFRLRAHKDAQPEFQLLAYMMLDAYVKSTPQTLRIGEWHMPLMKVEDRRAMNFSQEQAEDNALLARCVSRCARISYTNHGKETTLEEDVALTNKLSAAGHLSPFEHAAQAVGDGRFHGNFKGWKQLRKFYQNEDGLQPMDYTETLSNAPEWITKILANPPE